jgi:dTDP-4-dehydrorhamnose reductase
MYISKLLIIFVHINQFQPILREMKIILIFGGNGFIGSNIALLASSLGWKVYISDKEEKSIIPNVEFRAVDITNSETISSIINEISPNVIVNVAAIADIEIAEKEKEITQKVNVEGAINIGRLCQTKKIRHIFFSSDAVFDGLKDEYTETDIPSPVNYYGKTKTEAERGIMKYNPDSVIIRISLVLGFPLGRGNSFVSQIESKLKNGTGINAPTDIIRTPVDVHTLAKVVMELGQNSYSGIIHIGSLQKINRYDLTCKLAIALGYNPSLITPVLSTIDQAGKALRHKNGILNVNKAGEVLKTKMLTLNDTILNATQRF